MTIPFVGHYWGPLYLKPASNSPITPIPDGYTILQRLKVDNGIILTSIVSAVFPSALGIMDRVEQSVLPENMDALAFKTSFIGDLQMLSVTGAIIAQVAITALALPSLNGTHWIAKACFVVGLVFGCLSVWSSTTMARLLSRSVTAGALRSWLSKPAPKAALIQFKKIIGPRLAKAHACSDEEIADIQASVIAFLEESKWKEASFYSCLLLSAPSILLNCSLVSFLIGLGVYLGDVWKKDLDAVAGKTASRAVLIVYVVGTISGLVLFFGPSSKKDAEAGFVRKWNAALEVHSNRKKHSTDAELGVTSSSNAPGGGTLNGP
jgi:hypothetical protein